ncbi:MAG: acetoacetate decarboxylase family protein [Nitrososphaeria archaeon]
MGKIVHNARILGRDALAPGLPPEVPPLPWERDPKDIICHAYADPVFDNDILPLTYTNSRWMAFVIDVPRSSLEEIVPEPLKVEDTKVEFWYVDHNNTMLGPYYEMGVTVACSYTDEHGRKYYGGYYPYMYLSQDSAIFAGREPFGFPKKKAHIRLLEHGGGYQRGELPEGLGPFKPNRYFSVFMERRGYLIHTATGYYDNKPVPPPVFYGRVEYGRFNMKLTTSPDVKKTEWALTYLPSMIEGEHRFQLRRNTIQTASPDAIETFFLQATPFDNMGEYLDGKLLGLISFNFDLIIPPAQTVWTRTIERTDEDIAKHLMFSKPYKYTLRHDFPTPRYA